MYRFCLALKIKFMYYEKRKSVKLYSHKIPTVSDNYCILFKMIFYSECKMKSLILIIYIVHVLYEQCYDSIIRRAVVTICIALGNF